MSGTTGLTGSADATFVLEQESRASNAAKLYVTGRDTPYQEFTLRFHDCSWELVERKEQEQLAKEAIPDAADFTYICYDGDNSRGYPKLTVITVTTVTRLPCEGR